MCEHVRLTPALYPLGEAGRAGNPDGFGAADPDFAAAGRGGVLLHGPGALLHPPPAEGHPQGHRPGPPGAPLGPRRGPGHRGSPPLQGLPASDGRAGPQRGPVLWDAVVTGQEAEGQEPPVAGEVETHAGDEEEPEQEAPPPAPRRPRQRGATLREGPGHRKGHLDCERPAKLPDCTLSSEWLCYNLTKNAFISNIICK